MTFFLPTMSNAMTCVGFGPGKFVVGGGGVLELVGVVHTNALTTY